LMRVYEACFRYCLLKSICIPCSVAIPGKSCFEHGRLNTLPFESASRLTRLEKSCF
jgi:hypothetical protein